MNRNLFLACLCAVASPTLFAAGAGAADDAVCGSYIGWHGITDQNYVSGRVICPSDMRHKFTVMVRFDATKAEEQLAKCLCFKWCMPTGFSSFEQIEKLELGRDRIILFSAVGNVKSDKIKAVVDDRKGPLAKEFPTGAPIYKNVTCDRLPDDTGKLPFVIVFGPDGGDPLLAESVGDDTGKKLGDLRKDPKNKVPAWRPFYGSVEEPKYMKSFTKILKSGKPLEALGASCRKGISSKDPEQAKECQILYDALEQTRSDKLCTVEQTHSICPTRACWEISQLVKYWPKSRKSLKGYEAWLKKVPDIGTLMKMYNQLMLWGSEDFVCKKGESKKIIAELEKMKTTANKMVETSKDSRVQSAAGFIAAEAEAVAGMMPAKEPAGK